MKTIILIIVTWLLGMLFEYLISSAPEVGANIPEPKIVEGENDC